MVGPRTVTLTQGFKWLMRMIGLPAKPPSLGNCRKRKLSCAIVTDTGIFSTGRRVSAGKISIAKLSR